MSADFGDLPVKIDASGVSLARRPRLYWVDWELRPGPGVRFHPMEGRGKAAFREVELSAQVEAKDFLTPGSSKVSAEPFPTFTTSRPRTHPGRRPAGLDKLTPQEKEAWEGDQYRFPPYQYSQRLLVQESSGRCRIPNIRERERETIMGFPKDYAMQCMPKQYQGSETHEDERKSLIGNSWNVTVIVWLLAQLGHQLGLCQAKSPQEAVGGRGNEARRRHHYGRSPAEASHEEGPQSRAGRGVRACLKTPKPCEHEG